MKLEEKALSLEDKARQISFQNRFESFLDNKNGLSNPWVVELDPTTACNLACHGCISASLLNQGGFKRERIKERMVIGKERKLSEGKNIIGNVGYGYKRIDGEILINEDEVQQISKK